ncbi:hypothetical protein Taro_046887 [Colocasia esculenta]|uniref:Uncharacterized protein n=1 Tax=Colocasia esculenta TaxID=4460 RepID=A0A843WR93_COLES|nr:hypothetical protein [Colocasia esculenta]
MGQCTVTRTRPPRMPQQRDRSYSHACHPDRHQTIETTESCHDLLTGRNTKTRRRSRARQERDAHARRDKDDCRVGHPRRDTNTPPSLDALVSAALGFSSWLWLAAFLLLLGVLNCYYIYPINNNTNKVYSYSARVLLNLLLLCGCLGEATSFLWNKRAAAYSIDTRQVQSMDGPTSATLSGSLFYNTDRELESLSPGAR